jgi:hypothetical protein
MPLNSPAFTRPIILLLWLPFLLGCIEKCRIPVITLLRFPFLLGCIEKCRIPVILLLRFPFLLGCIDKCRIPVILLRRFPFLLGCGPFLATTPFIVILHLFAVPIDETTDALHARIGTPLVDLDVDG